LQAELRELTLIDGPLQPSRNYQFVCLVFIWMKVNLDRKSFKSVLTTIHVI
jgi:hypothetical protein